MRPIPTLYRRGPQRGTSARDGVLGGVTVSTGMLAARRHAGVHSPVIEGKMIIANQQMAYAA